MTQSIGSSAGPPAGPSACQAVLDELDALVAGDPDSVARHAEHLASCDGCRDARYDASECAAELALAGSDFVLPADFEARVLAAVDQAPAASAAPAGAAPAAVVTAPAPVVAAPPAAVGPSRRASRARVASLVAISAVAAGALGYAVTQRAGGGEHRAAAAGLAGAVAAVERAARDAGAGLSLHDRGAWRALQKGERVPAGASLRTDENTRAVVETSDGSRWTLDHRTELSFVDGAARRVRLTRGRLVAEVAHLEGHQAVIDTARGRVDVLGTRLAVTATDALTAVQVVRGEVAVSTRRGGKEIVRAGEEALIEQDTLAVSAAPGLARELQWSELGPKVASTEVGAGLGALRAYKPGESRDRDWALALASHDVTVRIVGPVARTEITETFRNDSEHTLEGVYQFPLPPDAQIDGLSLDVEGAPGGFEHGAFVDKQRAQKIWRGVIDRAAPKQVEIARDEIIWVDGNWRDPALLDWKRGGRFELRIFPIPAKGSRTIKIAYTQVVTPRGPWRQYVYPLAHSSDGSTVADRFSVDVEVRGAAQGAVRAAGYALAPDAERAEVSALTFAEAGFVPRGDLVVTYRAQDGDAELRAWSYAGNYAVAPDEALGKKTDVGNDERVLAAQRAVALDGRPTAVLALRPVLPRATGSVARDYLFVVDSSQSMVGERYGRASELAARMIEQLDRRDRFSVMTCDSECQSFGELRTPSVGAAAEVSAWLGAYQAGGSSDLVAALRAAAEKLPASPDRQRWIVLVGDGQASTGFRKAGDVESAVAESIGGAQVTTVGIGNDVDAALLAAAARGGGGSYLAWMPGQTVKAAALAALEATTGPTLRDVTLELPAGLADVAPAVVPTLRAGQELLIAARVQGEVRGEVVVRGQLAGQPFVGRYPLALAVSSAAGNAFVPKLWAQLAIEQLESRGRGEDRPRVVALSQGFGVMSKETSLLVLESPAMFEAFGVDRTAPAAKWTGQEDLEEVIVAQSATRTEHQGPAGGSKAADVAMPARAKMPAPTARKISQASLNDPLADDDLHGTMRGDAVGAGGLGRRGWGGGFAMRRTWVRVPALSPYQGVSAAIAKVLGDSERALAAAPDSRERHRALVQVLSYAGEVERAHALAQKWLERDRLDPMALHYQADLLGRAGARQEALRALGGVVDLDADRGESHQRLAAAYEQAGRLAKACSHRIALSALAPSEVEAGARAARCAQSELSAGDRERVLRGLADDATRAAVSVAPIAAPAPARGKAELAARASWTGGEDLDVSIITPDGTRISWMGGHGGARVTDATSLRAEALVLDKVKRGNYLVEIGRAQAGAGSGLVQGEIALAVLGADSSLAFSLEPGQQRKVVGRIAIRLEERLETLDRAAARVTVGHIANARARRVILARTPDLAACFSAVLAADPAARGRMMLEISVEASGATRTRAIASGELAAPARCVESRLASMHVEGSSAAVLRVPLSFSGR